VAARGRAPISDSAAHVFDRAAALASNAYVPTVEDVLHARRRTTGVVEESYWVDHVHFHVLDVGGQRNERRKWISSFEKVTALLFVVSLSDYDLPGEDDPAANRLMEALGLFAEVANSRWFEHSCILLLLNKRDLFVQKIATTDLRHEGDKYMPARFLDYSGGCNPDAALHYLETRFRELVHRERPIYTHVTCAVDTKAVKVLIKAVKDQIVRDSLRRGGMAGGGAD
jgi:guanine nucleotide-binding protein G(i) subunit alpha